MAFYIPMFLVTILLSKIAQKKNSFLILFMAIITVSLIAGLRGSDVGTDTNAYLVYINRISNGLSNLNILGINSSEIGFYVIVKSVYCLTQSSQCVLAFFAFATNYLIFKRIWDFKDDISVDLVVFFYLLVLFPTSMNIIRQYLAIAIIFFYSRYIGSTKGNVLFSIACIVASTIHVSAMLGITFLLIYNIIEKKQSAKRIILCVLGVILTIMVVSYLSFYVERYSAFFSYDSPTLSPIIIIRLLPLLAFLFVFKNRAVSWFKDNQRNVIRFITIAYFIGICLSLIGSFYSQANRIGMYNLVFELPFVGYACTNNRYRKLFLTYYIMFAIFIFAVKVYSGGEAGIIPYSFYWNN